MKDVTLLCLGSGLASRYKENTLQILALPPGTRIQFRYTADIIPDGLRQNLESSAIRGANVLLGHVDCTERGRGPDGYCRIVPCRYGNLIRSFRVGSVFVLQFELGDFAVTNDLDALQRNLPPSRPRWEEVNGGKTLKGAWCQELPAAFQACARSNDMADWQKTISDLAKCEDFSGQPYYYHVLGIFERGFESPVELKNGECVLRSNKDYELRVLHWDPSADSHTGHKETQWLKLDALEPWLEIRTSPLLAIDCPYDVGSVEIRTGSVSRKEHGLLVLRDDENGHPQNRIKVELCLPVKVKGTIVRTVLYGIALGTLLTSQQLIAIFSNKDVQAAVPLTIAAIALGMGTGLLLALGISKPL